MPILLLTILYRVYRNFGLLLTFSLNNIQRVSISHHVAGKNKLLWLNPKHLFQYGLIAQLEKYKALVDLHMIVSEFRMLVVGQ